jgi:ribosome-binding factor A
VSQRTERVDELLREEIGDILARDIADPRVGFVTVTDVETTPDLRHAKVWVSVIGPAADRAATLAALRHAMGYVQHALGSRLRIKRIPSLHVHLDDTAERGTRVLRLLDQLGSGEEPAATPVGETLPTPVRRLARDGDAEEPAPVAEPDAPRPPGRRPRPKGTTRATGPGRGGAKRRTHR